MTTMTVTILHNTTEQVRPGCWDCTNCRANGWGDPADQPTCPTCGAPTKPLTSPAIFLRCGRDVEIEPGDTLTEIGTLTVDAASMIAAAEAAFEAGNAPYDTPNVRTYRSWNVRSLSAGDVVIVTTPDGPQALGCAGMGWVRVELDGTTVRGVFADAR